MSFSNRARYRKEKRIRIEALEAQPPAPGKRPPRWMPQVEANAAREAMHARLGTVSDLDNDVIEDGSPPKIKRGGMQGKKTPPRQLPPVDPMHAEIVKQGNY